MKITDPAKKELAKLLNDNQADGLMVVLQESCCGTSPVFQMVRFEEGDQPEEIADIKVLMDQPAKEAVEDVVIDLKDGELVVFNPVCGCGGGCGDHEDDHECCGGHDEGQGCCGNC